MRKLKENYGYRFNVQIAINHSILGFFQIFNWNRNYTSLVELKFKKDNFYSSNSHHNLGA